MKQIDNKQIYNGNLLSYKGMLMAEFPTEPSITNVILQAYKRDCLDSVLKIISMLSYCSALFKRMQNGES